jgi:hypothetical protein
MKFFVNMTIYIYIYIYIWVVTLKIFVRRKLEEGREGISFVPDEVD